ncbi:ethylmalonyl-CoA decarboxylase [Syngnathoides biaculeatus]|uniref:ethylmalonyl-CoA decarboxylase n=1 Tax=Syngnathoides biaculeatus TaxID=300417 RepID=UPI002ADE2373|nr:ethylmalonyl-CoA decarboxylase [Syngnathoides biaculeatus]XP_061674978.1 ethylmalonyl-CoA decarboxylase [Syngnathoides biaculeatus]
MVICAASRHLLRGRHVCGTWARMWQRQSSGRVYTELDFDQEEMKEKLLGFPGGTIELNKQESGIAVLTINNPSRMNAFTGTMMVQLEEKVSQLEQWVDGKGLILQGAAGTFCSGSDLVAVKAITKPQDGMKMCMFMQNALTRLLRLPLISVALVEGRALGGGAELATACDFRLMAPGSLIQFVHKHMGVVPGWGGAARLIHLIGSQNSLKLLSGASKVNPEFGLQIHLADGVLQDPQVEEGVGTVMQQAEKWLRHYTQGPPPVIQAMKKVVLSGRELPLVEALRTEKEVFGTVWGGPANLQALTSKSKYK